MTTEQPYDLWHKSRPKPGEPECPQHPGLVASAQHGDKVRWRARWRNAEGGQRSKDFPENRKTAAIAHQRKMRAAVDEERKAKETRESRPRARRAARPTELADEQAVPTIAEYVETFLRDHEARDGTIETYGYRLRGHVVPVLGERPITALMRADYKGFFTDLKAAGQSDGSRSQIKKALSAMLSAAMDDRDFGHLMPGNQVIGIRLPQGQRQKAELSWAHVVALAEEITPEFEMLIWYGALQGLRSMEAAGVRTFDMKCRRGLLQVEEQRQDGKGVDLKTKHSRAVLPMGSFLIDKYAAHMRRRSTPPSADVVRHRQARGYAPRPAEFEDLVTLGRYGTPVRESALCRAFNLARDRCRAKGVKVPEATTFRDLRDFMDAVLIAAGVAPRSVQVRMRHGTLDETITTYGFALEVDWENAPASFKELYGFEAPPGLPEVALVPQAERAEWRAARAGRRPFEVSSRVAVDNGGAPRAN